MEARKRFAKKDWRDLGLEHLARDGGAALTVDALCEAAARTRGSFYHHFQDHGVFLEALFLEWKQRNTLDVADAILQQPQGKRAQTLSDIANMLDQDLERAVRQFAQSNAIARTIVQDVDEIRTEFVVGLYRVYSIKRRWNDKKEVRRDGHLADLHEIVTDSPNHW